MLFPMVPSRIVVEWFYFIPVNHPRPFEGTEVHEARRLELHLGMRTAVRMFDPISILSLMASGSVITWSILSQLQKARPLLFWRVLDQCTRKKTIWVRTISIKPTLTLQSNLRQLGSIKLRSALSPHPPCIAVSCYQVGLMCLEMLSKNLMNCRRCISSMSKFHSSDRNWMRFWRMMVFREVVS